MNTGSLRLDRTSLMQQEDGRFRAGLNKALQSLRSFATLSECLRVLGAGIVLASMSLYLMQGWQEGNDISRYLMLLAQTGLLGLAGFAMSQLLQEARGARVFFALTLVSIPVNFTILGALLYSVVQWDGALTTYPGFATWRLDEFAATGLTIAAALLVLVPAAWFCFAVMARKSAGRLTAHFLLLNLLLLVPVRLSLFAGSIALVGIAFAVAAVRRQLARDSALATAEGRLALGALYLPMGIMLARSLYFYDVDSLMVAMLAFAAYLAMRQTALFPHRRPPLASGLNVASLPVAAIVAVALGDAVSPALSFGWLPTLAALVYALLAGDVWRRAAGGRVRSLAAGTACIALAAGFSAGVAVESSAVSASLALFAGAVLVLCGVRSRKPLPVAAGVVTISAGAAFGFAPLLELVLDSSWATLAAFGIGTIVLASILERHGVSLRERSRRWLRAFSARPADGAAVDRALVDAQA